LDGPGFLPYGCFDLLKDNKDLDTLDEYDHFYIYLCKVRFRIMALRSEAPGEK